MIRSYLKNEKRLILCQSVSRNEIINTVRAFKKCRHDALLRKVLTEVLADER